ncbi:unnamed protein product [Acanthoscelides obtectus]|uniref:Uncharacterized protein n=1 Tax=Acanthoscelides obtectus TaxID=200917 RepID=A0A9P0LI74_ACAOB|nr:unnamed protein product [Acanthoscelides obtectus]CAK1670069.1 hypothetical protein AOBTE_LOCUS27371 [Acanthoscelides obtectus]
MRSERAHTTNRQTPRTKIRPNCSINSAGRLAFLILVSDILALRHLISERKLIKLDMFLYDNFSNQDFECCIG